MDERRLEVKIGALLLATIVSVFGLLALMGELSFGARSVVKVDFSHTGNVVVGAPVKLGGVRVGRVDEIVLHPERLDSRGAPLPVQMLLAIDPKIAKSVHVDAVVTVSTLGPLGEAYLELYTGSPSSPPLRPEQALRGVDAPRLDLVAGRLSAFLEAASDVLEEDPAALSKFTAGVSRLANNVDTLLNENRASIRTLAEELAAAAEDLRALSRLAREQLPQASKDAASALAGLSALSSQLTPEDGRQLKNAIARYAGAGEKLERLAVRGEKLLERIEAGEGTLGGAVKDPRLYDDLRELVRDLRKHPWKILWKE